MRDRSKCLHSIYASLKFIFTRHTIQPIIVTGLFLLAGT